MGCSGVRLEWQVESDRDVVLRLVVGRLQHKILTVVLPIYAGGDFWVDDCPEVDAVVKETPDRYIVMEAIAAYISSLDLSCALPPFPEALCCGEHGIKGLQEGL